MIPSRRLAVLTQHIVQEEEEAKPEALIKGFTAEEKKKFIAQHHHGVFLPEKLEWNESWKVVRSAISPEKLVSRFPYPDHEIQTLYENFEASVVKYSSQGYLGSRQKRSNGSYGSYKWLSYIETAKLRTEIGSGLMHLGLGSGSTVGIFSINCKEWVLLDAACHAYSMVTVPLYDTLGPDVASFICNHAETEAVGCSAVAFESMLETLPTCPMIKAVIVWDMDEEEEEGLDQQFLEPNGASSCQILSLRQLAALGKQNLQPHKPPTPDDLALICYTSGTTGTPKGAKLSHQNVVANAAGNVVLLPEDLPGHRHLSYLPLAHIYERMNLTMCTHMGACYGFYHGDVLNILDDIAELKPTLFSSVPRLFNRIYDKVMASIRESGIITQQLFAAAYAAKKAALMQGDISQARFGYLYDLLVFSKLREKLGGKIEYLVTGASPISADVFDFLRICFGAIVIEGYGMTETSCTITITNFSDILSGHVGSPVPCCEVKLVDIPEMNYFAIDKPHPRGEICVRGPTLFKGYHKDEKQTAEVIDEDGWFHTGDVGCWLEGGRLKIIDRKKNLFKLAQGEYVAPEKIENVYIRCPMVAQVFVYGDSLKSKLVAIVVPDVDVLLPWAKQQGIRKNLDGLCIDQEVVECILDSMQAEGRVAGLAGFEQVQAICLLPQPFTVENDLLTPTFKLKRPQARERFSMEIEKLYQCLETEQSKH